MWVNTSHTQVDLSLINPVLRGFIHMALDEPKPRLAVEFSAKSSECVSERKRESVCERGGESVV